MCSRINVAFSGKNNKDVEGYMTLCSVIQAWLIEIVSEVRLKGAAAFDTLLSSNHTHRQQQLGLQKHRA
jgi:hypothetical protein